MPKKKVEEKVVVNGKTWNKESLAKYRKYQIEFNKENYKQYSFRLSYKSDADIIDKLSSVDSSKDYIKELIRKDIAKKNKKSH